MGVAFLGKEIGGGLRAGPEGERRGDVLGEGLEVGAVGHRGALALQLDDRADILRGIGIDRQTPRRGFTVGAHRLRLDALLAEPFHGLLRVAAALLKGLFAFHHRQSGLVPECHDRCCRDLCHG